MATVVMHDGWTRTSDNGWLQGKPSYVKTINGTEFYIAQDYDDLDSGSQKLMWFIHTDLGFLAAHETLTGAKAIIEDKGAE